jgi:hypothetical protein
METSAIYVREEERIRLLASLSKAPATKESTDKLGPALFANILADPAYTNKKSPRNPFAADVNACLGVPYFAFSGLKVGGLEYAIIAGRTRELLPFQPPLDMATPIFSNLCWVLFSQFAAIKNYRGAANKRKGTSSRRNRNAGGKLRATIVVAEPGCPAPSENGRVL